MSKETGPNLPPKNIDEILSANLGLQQLYDRLDDGEKSAVRVNYSQLSLMISMPGAALLENIISQYGSANNEHINFNTKRQAKSAGGSA